MSKLEAAGALAPGVTTIQAVGLLSPSAQSKPSPTSLRAMGGQPVSAGMDDSALSQLLLRPAANSDTTFPQLGT